MERSSRVLHHGNPEIWFFFQKKSSKFEFWLSTKSWNHHSFVNIGPTLVIDASMERSSRVLHQGNPKIWIFFQKSSKFEFWLSTNSWNHPSFVNVSPTLVIDTSMERPSRVLHHGNPKIWFFQKSLNFDFWQRDEITLASSISVLHYWYINGMVFTSTSPWKPKNVNFFQKVGNRRNWILSVPRVSVCREKKSPWLCQYQSYISNWYVNGNVLEYYNMGTKNLIFFQKSLKLNLTCAEINIQVGLTYMSTSGMHRRPFEGRHLVLF